MLNTGLRFAFGPFIGALHQIIGSATHAIYYRPERSVGMLYLMAPLEEHYDGGFGAIGDAFHRAAQTLEKESAGKRMQFGNRHRSRARAGKRTAERSMPLV